GAEGFGVVPIHHCGGPVVLVELGVRSLDLVTRLELAVLAERDLGDPGVEGLGERHAVLAPVRPHLIADLCSQGVESSVTIGRVVACQCLQAGNTPCDSSCSPSWS